MEQQNSFSLFFSICKLDIFLIVGI